MDISAEKLNLIQRICEIQDTDLLDLIQNIIDIQKSTKSDWWYTLQTEEQLSIERGLSDLEKGKVRSHDQVRKRYEKYLKD